MKKNFVITIKAEDRPGLLHLVTGFINKKLIPIKGLSAAPTDIHDIVLITIEIFARQSEVIPLVLKIENIIEVYAVETNEHSRTHCLRSAYFMMAKAFLESPRVSILQKYDLIFVDWYSGAFLLAKFGTDATIRKVYNELDGPHLLGFSQSGLIAESKLIANKDIERISRLAA
jgi:acetolactate synthase small subunit